MKKLLKLTAASAALAALAMAGAHAAQSREVLRIVGSSTVFPFTTAVAENFGAKSRFSTPVVESTGTGGGMNLFCAGVGMSHPDITGASRRMKESEYRRCQDNGVTAITEVMIGFDGIVIGNSVDVSQAEMDRTDLFLALASEIPTPVDAGGEALVTPAGTLVPGASFSQVAGYSCESFVTNPYTRWSDIDPGLPNVTIEVYGPPPTSGTRDAFVELGLHPGAEGVECLNALKAAGDDRFEAIASRVREDGRWIDSGENDNTIVQTLANTPTAFGIFGYSFLEQNSDRIQGTVMEGIEPTYDAIAEGDYPISRSMFIYVKNQHADVVPGVREFVTEFTSEEAWGPFGYLAERGLIALTDERRAEEAASARALTPMDGAPVH